MRRILVAVSTVLLLSATAFTLPALCAPAASRVARVVLYPDMAEVTRIVAVVAPEVSVLLSGLSANLVAESLSAKVLEGNARIAGVSVDDVFRAEPVQEKVQELAARIDELGDRKRLAEE